MPVLRDPLVAAYLAELDQALAGADPRERSDTVAAVREHLADALAGEHTRGRVAEVLADLGPVDQIAAAATPAGTPTPVAVPVWRPRLTLVMAVASLVLVVLIPVIAVPLALAALVLAAGQLAWARGQARSTLWSAVAASTATLVAALILGLTLVQATSGTLERGEGQMVDPEQVQQHIGPDAVFAP